MRHRVVRVLSVLAVLVSTTVLGAPRRIVVISDTHWGVGKVRLRWHPLEDFRWTNDFAAFLRHLAGTPTDLVINGDMFELWQSLWSDCRAADPELGCSEQEAIRRLEHVLGAHEDDLASLRAFATAGDNRVIIVPGNHDAALLLPEVRDTLLHAARLPTGRLIIAPDGMWRSADGTVVATHGHEADEFNAFVAWPTPFIERDGVRYLRRPAGEQFVQGFFNAIEKKYPIIDNIQEEGAALGRGLMAEGFRTQLVHAPRFVHLLLARMSPTQRTATLGPQKDTALEDWDEVGIRTLGPSFFLQSVPSNAPLHQALVRAVERGELAAAAQRLTSEEITAICRERDRVAAFDARIAPCPSRTLGRAAGFAYDKSQEDVERYVAKLADERTKVVVLSHTHIPLAPRNVPLSQERTVLSVNTGAWQRTIPIAELETIDRSRRPGAILRRSPSDLPACYPFVLITPTSGGPIPSLHYWRLKGTRWSPATACH